MDVNISYLYTYVKKQLSFIRGGVNEYDIDEADVSIVQCFVQNKSKYYSEKERV